MDAVELILKDHESLRNLFSAYEAAGDDAQKRGIVHQIAAEIEAHAGIEETLFYPEVRERATDADDIVEHSWEEHMEANELLAEVRKADVGGRGFDEKLAKLRESITHHMEDEEEKMIPRAEKAIPSDRRQVLGEEMMARKMEILETLRKEEKVPKAEARGGD